MEPSVPFCDTPRQSAAVGVLAGIVGGGVGLLFEAGLWSVITATGLLAAVGDIGVHLLRGDEQFRAAVRQARRELHSRD
jgi:hypothetical protein